MKMIEPFDVTPARMLSSTVPITETEWTAGTYTTGTRRYVGADLYEVVATPDTSTEPVAGAALDPPAWLRVGAINRFAAFDGIVGRPAEVASGSMFWRIQGVGLVNGVALFGLEGETATVRIRRQADDEVLLARSWSLRGRGVPTDYWEWAFRPFEETDTALVTDGPSLTNAIVEIEVDGGPSRAALGEAFLGTVQQLGVTLYGTSAEIEDFSRRERDPFGNFIIVGRPSTRLVRYTVSVRNADLSRVDRLLRARLARPTVYIGDEGFLTTVLPGFPRNIQSVPLGPTVSEMLFEVEGLI